MEKTVVGSNDVLVSNNMIFQASIAALGENFDLGFFFDLACLIEAVILHDHLVTVEAELLPEYSSLPLRQLLIREGVLQEHSVRISSDAIKNGSHTLRGLARLADDEFPHGKEQFFDGVILSEWLTSIRRPSSLDETNDYGIYRRSSLPVSFLVNEGLEKGSPQYFKELLRNWTLHGHGYSPDPNASFLMRSLLYLTISEELKLSFCPDFSRVLIVANLNNRLRYSLSQEAYFRIAKAFALTIDDLRRANAPFSVQIPPLPALVLAKCSTLKDLGNVLLDYRKEFSGLRNTYRQYEQTIRHPKTLGESLKARKELIEVSERLAKSYPLSDSRLIQESVSFLEAAIKAGRNPSDPTSYSADLLIKPLEWVREWWIRRRAYHLFRLKKKLDNLIEYESLLQRLFNFTPTSDDISLFAKVSAQSEKLYFAID